MIKTFVCAILCGFVASGMAVSAANDPADEKAVMATLEAMAKATIAKDVATLARIYGEDVTYSHSSAQNQTKAEVLKAFDGPSQAEFMKFSDSTIRIYGNVALVKGVTDFRNGQPGKMLDNHLDILWVMVRRPEGPHGWQIVARQTTRIGPSVGTPVPAK
jgi:ketosteroid isomerase-like protein